MTSPSFELSVRRTQEDELVVTREAVTPSSGSIPLVPSNEEVLAQITKLGEDVRALIVMMKRLPKVVVTETYQDRTRSLAMAQEHLQTGFLWLRKTVNVPLEF